MRRLRLTPRAYRRLTLLALFAVAAIIVTGAAVRLTGSGLGCSDWPNCEEGQLVSPHEFHGMVEFGNRLFTGLVSVAAIAAVLGALLRAPRRRDLVWLSWGIVGGIVGQIVLGGLVVIFELKPPLVMGHFLLSILLLACALVLHHRAGLPDGGVAEPATAPVVRHLARAALVLTGAALFTGTIVTAAGPHAGDETAERLSWPLPDVTRAHGSTVVVLVLTVVALLVASVRTGAPTTFRRGVVLLIGALVVQATIGYVQYFNGVPALLVGFHVAVAVVVFSAAMHVQFALYRWQERPAVAPARPAPSERAPALA